MRATTLARRATGSSFADMDARIRAASGGARTLDDVILPLFAKRRNGVPLTSAMLVDAFVKEIGATAGADFEAIIIRGETITPVPNAFGPCFERRARTDAATGQPIDGFEWIRVPAIPDERCRAW